MTERSSYRQYVVLEQVLQKLCESGGLPFDSYARIKLQDMKSMWERLEGPPRTHVYGQVNTTGENDSPQFRGWDSSGRAMRGEVAYDDPQTISGAESAVVETDAVPAPAVEKECRAIARNRTAAYDDRMAALRAWMAMDDDDVSVFVVEELYRTDLTDNWRNALVYAAENVHFKDSAQQARIRARLRELALELRDVSQPGTEHVVWSAMRRYTSLMPPEEANDLAQFLDRKGVVDTRMVALQCIARVFQLGPPADAATLDPLARRVAEYAAKFLDPDVFGGGTNSSIARNAVLALAVLGSPELEACVGRVNALGRRWLSRQVRRQLQELLDGWRGHGVDSTTGAAFGVVERALESIRLAKTD
ncbi:MAG: hypothetical protein JXB62_17240 [Pirellulales bacterium]|nr:hypothetical protein [Pirellulales bacterium]